MLSVALGYIDMHPTSSGREPTRRRMVPCLPPSAEPRPTLVTQAQPRLAKAPIPCDAHPLSRQVPLYIPLDMYVALGAHSHARHAEWEGPHSTSLGILPATLNLA